MTAQISLPIAPLLVWLTVQLAALAIGAAGVALSARAPRPVETLSLHIMLVAQIALASLLWPMLFRGARASVVTIAVAIPFMQAAGFLSATPQGDLLRASAVVLLWLTTLAVLPSHGMSPIALLITRSAVVFWSIGCAVVAFLQADFLSGTPYSWTGPSVSIFALLRGEHPYLVWVAAIAPLAVAGAMRFFVMTNKTELGNSADQKSVEAPRPPSDAKKSRV